MKTFSLFGTEHLYTLLGYFIFMIIILFLSSFADSKKRLARNISILIAVLKIAELSYRHYIHGEQMSSLLPLHLCNLALLVAIISMIFQKKFLFQFVYFWSAGAIFALLTPEVRYSFPNFLNISFFITHFYLIFSVLYELIYFKFKPTKTGFINSFILINIIALFVYFINSRLGTNYLYINYKPNFNSPLDYFGDWPYYIFIIEAIYLFISLLLYLPFRQRSYKIKIN